jgi:hypothetical protein
MEAICDVMVMFYKDNLERMEKLLNLIEQQSAELKIENVALKRQYETLEEWANTQELRANALADVIDRFIVNSGDGVQRDLMEAFNEVAEDLDVDLDFLTEQQEFDSESTEEIVGDLDNMFD